MPLMLIPFLVGGGFGAWWTKEVVDSATGGEAGRPPYFMAMIVLAALFVAWRKGWLK
ncbi:hypothetical protein [Vibrio taketomensis]|uniref:hypothetical protein n=1 Tax=Vibrio taketomensis TaxID=2572923 RepID=UPI001389D82C|nr:hypothetical protein [Vibrio taketomensis]